MTNSNPILRPSKQFWLFALGVVLAGCFAWGNIASWSAKLRYPGEENLAEGVPLTEMLHFRAGVRIYDPPSRQKFDTPSYGPLYYLLGARLIDPERPAYLPLRLLSLAGTLGCVAASALLALWLSGSKRAALVAALIFLSYRFVTLYGISDRCDLVALLFCFSGFLIAYRFQDGPKLLWAALPILLGLFYKQQFVAAPLAVLLFLLLGKQYRRMVQFGALLGAGGLVLLGFFEFVVFRGQAFLRHFLLYVGALPFSLHRLGLGAFIFVVWFAFPMVVAIEFLRRHSNRLVACYVGVALFLSIVMFAKEGSDANYFIESALILSTLFAAFLIERVPDFTRGPEVLFLLILTLLPSHLFAESPPEPQDFIRDQAIQTFLRRRFPPHTLAFGYYTGDLVRAGLDAPVSALWVYNGLVRRGVIASPDVVSMLESRSFAVVVLNFDLEREQNPSWLNYYLTELQRNALLANYEPVTNLEMPEPEKFRATDRFYIWVPKSTSHNKSEF